MEDFVAAVKVFCQDQNWKGLGDYINDSASLILKNASRIDSAIAALDPREHTLGYLGLVVIKLSFPNLGDFELFFNQIQQLIEVGCRNQISQGVDKFCYVCHYLVKSLVEQKKAFRGIYLICKAIDKIQQCPTELTSLHADLMQLCLVAKCMKPGLKYLDFGITTISAEMNKDAAKSFLLYYYYGGMVYLSVKEYEKALFCFQAAVTTPAMSLSQIMLEAYKKYMLLSVLLIGKVDVDDIVNNFFNYDINSPTKMKCRVFLNVLNKFCYFFVNYGTFQLLDLVLNGHFMNYGGSWVDWASKNATRMDFNTRQSPTPGNQMLPTFGLCDLMDTRNELTKSYINKYTVMCEMSSHLLYQYMFTIIWFLLVFSTTVSVLGIILHLCGHLHLLFIVKRKKLVQPIARLLRHRELEYLEFVRRRDLALYGKILRKLQTFKIDGNNNLNHQGTNGHVIAEYEMSLTESVT